MRQAGTDGQGFSQPALQGEPSLGLRSSGVPHGDFRSNGVTCGRAPPSFSPFGESPDARVMGMGGLLWLSQQGDTQYSSHSSSNTLSSNASSNHSDDRWFDVPDPIETEPDPLSKGGSSDSGIDTTLYACSPASGGSGGAGPKPPRPASQRDKVPKTPSACYAGLQDDGVHPGDKKREPSPTVSTGSQGKSYRHKVGTPGASGTPSSSPDPFKQPR